MTKTLPGTINHNAAVVSNTILHEEASSKTRELAMNIFNNAVAQKYQSPIQVQAAALELNQIKDPAATLGAKMLADAAELKTKLPIFDIEGMKEAGFPKEIIDAGHMVNQKLISGTDSGSLQEAASSSPQISSDISNPQ